MTPREKFEGLMDEFGRAWTGSFSDRTRARIAVLAAYDEAARPVAAGEWVMGLQKRCVDWNVYWRAPDAHGVQLNIEQATELLRDVLGVEVEIAAAIPASDLPVADESDDRRPPGRS